MQTKISKSTSSGPLFAALLCGAACSSGSESNIPPQTELIGSATAAIQLVPPNVKCVTIQVTNGTANVSRSFNVSPTMSAAFALSGLPLGTDVFQASAGAAACGDAGASPAVFASGPVTASVAVGASPSITLVMQPVADSGAASVGVNFPTPPGTITEFEGVSGFSATSMTAGPDGNLWVILAGTSGQGTQIAKVTSAGAVVVVPTPAGLGNALAIATGSDGNLWFTTMGNPTAAPPLASQLVRIAPDGSGFVAFSYGDTSTSALTALTTGADGALWVVDRQRNAILRVLTSGTLRGTFTIPTSNVQPQSIVSGSDGNLWFTENDNFFVQVSTKIGRLNPNSGAIVEFSLAGPPIRITSGSDGNLWATITVPLTGGSASIAKITPAGSVTQFTVPTPNVGVSSITAGPDGNVWFLEHPGGSSTVVRVKLDGTMTEFPIPTMATASTIAAGPDGNVWFGEGTPGKIGRIAP